MNKVTIMRGIPGSGKSTWIRDNVHGLVVSADEYFSSADGSYKFDPTLLPAAHNDCLKRFLSNVYAGRESIVVDNTNIRTYEIAPYYRLAEVYGYEVEVIWLVCAPSLAIKRGIHGVPEDLVRSMAISFEPLPSWWNVRIIPIV